MNRKKVAFKTFGCKLNFSETSAISRKFKHNGFDVVDFKDKADIYVINSCTVTANAEKKCKAAIRQSNRRNPDAKIAVIGCLSQLIPDELKKFHQVDFVLGSNEKFNLLDCIKNIENSDKAAQKYVFTNKISEITGFIPSYSSGYRTRSFLKIQDGCDYYCSYCIIPYARGHSRSDTIANSTKLAKEIAKKGIKEIVLTGVNIGDFGKNNNENFYELICELDKIEGIERYRISSIEPDLLYDEIIDFVAGSKKFLPHFHIPLQSGSNKILNLMHRKYNRELFAGRVDKIKLLMPHSCIAADVIVGFPGESDNDFIDTYNFIESIDITYAHVFSYSERPGTLAQKLPDKISNKIIKKRSRELQNLSAKKKKYFYQQNINRSFKVLFESDMDNGFMHGFTENYIKVKTKYNPKLINQIILVELKNLDEDNVYVFDV